MKKRGRKGHLWIEKKERQEKSIQSGLIDVHVNVSPIRIDFVRTRGDFHGWRFYVGPARMDVVDETEALQRFFEGKRANLYVTFNTLTQDLCEEKRFIMEP